MKLLWRLKICQYKSKLLIKTFLNSF